MTRQLWSNEKLNSSSNWFDLVFSILSNFFEDNLYKSTLKSAIIRYVKPVCLHSKQTAEAVWEKINSTCLRVKNVDFGDYLSVLYNLIVITYHDVQWVPVLARHCLGRLYAVLLKAVFFCLYTSNYLYILFKKHKNWH